LRVRKNIKKNNEDLFFGSNKQMMIKKMRCEIKKMKFQGWIQAVLCELCGEKKLQSVFTAM